MRIVDDDVDDTGDNDNDNADDSLYQDYTTTSLCDRRFGCIFNENYPLIARDSSPNEKPTHAECVAVFVDLV